MLLIKNTKKREAALKNEAGGDEKHLSFFLLGLIHGCLEIWNFSSRVRLDISLIRCAYL